MSWEQIIQSFIAFNINSLNNLLYMIKTNLWLVLSVVGALAIIVMNLKEEMELPV